MNIKINKVSAGALHYVLVISVIIAIILLSFVLLVKLELNSESKNNFYKQAIFNVHEGVMFLERETSLDYGVIKKDVFSQNNQENTSILKKRWGIFDLGIVDSKVGKEFFKKIALLGGVNEDKKALFLKDNNLPLVMVGNAKIEGDAFLPKSRVKAGNIQGVSFTGEYFINGKVYNSNTKLPTIENITHIKKICNVGYKFDSISKIELADNLMLTQSFENNTLLFETSQSLLLHDIKLKGNIVIQSSQKIIVDKTAKLQDVILISPDIEISNGVEGSFQAFSDNSISVGENCKLKYPSALVVVQNGIIDNKKQIFIDKKSIVKGVVLYYIDGENKNYKFIPQVLIKENASLIGEVYCKGNVELSGNVIGSISTHNFLANQFGNVYVNHIYNGEININNLPSQYVGLMSDFKNKAVVKWLY